MKKRLRKVVLPLSLISMLALGSTNVFANEIVDNTETNSQVEETILEQFEEYYNDVDTVISETSETIGNTKIIITTYIDKDGDTVTNTLSYEINKSRSNEYTAYADLDKNISGWATINLKATFKYYTQGYFSYVKCSSAIGEVDLASESISAGKPVINKDSNYVTIGKADASISISMKDSRTDKTKNGSLTITCTDTGRISSK